MIGRTFIFSASLFILMLAPFSFAMSATESPPVVELERSIHFLTPSGDDVLVEAGEYEVEAAEEWIQLIPKGGARSEAMLLAASRSPHMREVAASEVLSIPGGEDEEYVWLLLPDGQSWAAKGSHSGVRTRSATGDARLHGGYEYRGNPIFTFDKVEHGVGFCLMLVEHDYGEAFTWDSKEKSCRIFSKVNDVKMVANPSFVSGTRIAPFFPKRINEYEDSGWEQALVIIPVFNGFAGRGGYKTFHNASLQECQVWCAQDGECRVFSWKKDTNTCYLRNEDQRLSPNTNYISGWKTHYLSGLLLMRQGQENRQTAIHIPKCITAAQQGPKRYVTPLYGQDWNCAPFELIKVHDNPDLQRRVVNAIYPDGLPSGVDEAEWFNMVYNNWNLATSPPATHLLIGYISHPRKYEKNDVAKYVLAVSRVSAEELVIHHSGVAFRAGGILGEPIIGDLVLAGISEAVTAAFGGLAFPATAVNYTIKKIVSENNAGTEANANYIIGAIALSAHSVLPNLALPAAQITIALPR